MLFRFFFGLTAAVLLASCGTQLPDDVAIEYEKLPLDLDFNLHVKPILSDKCFACHGPDKAKIKAGLRLDLAEVALGELPETPGKRALTPGNLGNSEVFHRIISDDPEYQMPDPESNLVLSAHEKAVLVKWIENGAEYKPHWAFIKPEKPHLPQVENSDWIQNPVDNFVLKKLENKNLHPSSAADKELLLRRLSFDLTGLPPTPSEIKGFLEDKSLNAYARQVDRLLASPHYGEKMAMDWMDLARFADTHGYTVDRYRDMSPWRDWVIDAFNRNVPYDEFILWQLAGDLLPDPSREQILATAFLRIHPQNMEGGIVPEEFRVEYVLDRVSTVGQAFMGLTVGCARCHDHKYDPITQKNFYEMSSFFNNVNESGQISFDNAMPVPTMLLPNADQAEILEFIDTKIAASQENMELIRGQERVSFQNWMQNEEYRRISQKRYPNGLQAKFNFENEQLSNSLNASQTGKMARTGSNEETPNFVRAQDGDGLLMNGDAWLDLTPVGVFRRSQPFTVALSINIPEDLANGVIFHKGQGAILFNFRGYHLALKEDRLQLLMAHTSPDNAIIEYAIEAIPRRKWINLAVTYDGSSQAQGFRLYMNGDELATEVERDNLYKDILLSSDIMGRKDYQPGLQIGARDRGKGIGGAVVDNILVFNKEMTPLEIMQVANRTELDKVIQKTAMELSPADSQMLNTYYLANYSSSYKMALNNIEQVRSAYADSAEVVKEVMVMKEMPGIRRTYVLERGRYDSFGEEVFPNTPQSILPMPKDLPPNRLGLARWLVHEDHPLTARVAVNRYWQNYFGRGIVRTTEDFGNQGELPSHPDLLDWLAMEFVESGWDVKNLQKLLVTSATYRQSSIASNALLSEDAENVLLARGPAVRLSAEMIRDNALMASGLLNSEIGGESVSPYQPADLWKVNNTSYHQDSGDKLYRRSMYTIWKRSVPHPTLATFDAPERSECTVRRQKTNTPLQALVLLNDPTFVEASKVIGETIARSDNLKMGISEAFLRLTGREPASKELEILLELQQKEFSKFSQDPGKAKGWLTAGEYETDQSLDASLISANAVVASVIMNADAAITKR